MITTLAKLGLHQHIQIILDYKSENVTATIIFSSKNKSDDDDDKEHTPPIQIEGTVAEVEAHLASEEFTAGVARIEGIHSSLNEAAEKLETKKKEKAVKEEKDAEAKAKKEQDKKSAPVKGKKSPTQKPKSAGPDKSELNLADVPTPALRPAWKKPAPVVAEPPPADEDLADLFKE